MNQPPINLPFIHPDGSLWFLRPTDIDPYFTPRETETHSQAIDPVTGNISNILAHKEWRELRMARKSAEANFSGEYRTLEEYYEMAIIVAATDAERSAFCAVYFLFLQTKIDQYVATMNRLITPLTSKNKSK